jgi:hypothetical protein
VSLPPVIKYGKLLQIMQLGGWRVEDSATRIAEIRRLVRRSGNVTYPPYFIVMLPQPPGGNFKEFRVDTAKEVPAIRNALHLSREDGVPDDQFYRYLQAVFHRPES